MSLKLHLTGGVGGGGVYFTWGKDFVISVGCLVVPTQNGGAVAVVTRCK